MKGIKFVIVILALFSSFLWAKEKVVEAEGFAPLTGNKSLDKKNAVEDALRRALEKAIGAHISAETVVKNYQLISDKIISRVSGFVKGYQVLSEKESHGVLTVKVRATVMDDSLKNALQALKATLERMNYPRTAVMIAEQNVGMTYFSYWWGDPKNFQSNMSAAETAVTSFLLDKGFKVVDRQALAGKIQIKAPYKVVDLSNQDVLTMYKNSGIDVVIVGKALAKQRGRLMNSDMHSVVANVTLRAINLHDGRVIGSGYASVSKLHIDPTTAGTEAISEAAKKAMEKLAARIVKVWSSILNNGDDFTVEVRSLPDSGMMFKAEEALKSIKGINAVLMRNYGNGSATFTLSFRGTTRDLAEKLKNKFKVIAVAGKKVVLELK